MLTAKLGQELDIWKTKREREVKTECPVMITFEIQSNNRSVCVCVCVCVCDSVYLRLSTLITISNFMFEVGFPGCVCILSSV